MCKKLNELLMRKRVKPVSGISGFSMDMCAWAPETRKTSMLGRSKVQKGRHEYEIHRIYKFMLVSRNYHVVGRCKHCGAERDLAFIEEERLRNEGLKLDSIRRERKLTTNDYYEDFLAPPEIGRCRNAPYQITKTGFFSKLVEKRGYHEYEVVDIIKKDDESSLLVCKCKNCGEKRRDMISSKEVLELLDPKNEEE